MNLLDSTEWTTGEPEKEGRYLVTLSYGNRPRFVTIGDYDPCGIRRVKECISKDAVNGGWSNIDESYTIHAFAELPPAYDGD